MLGADPATDPMAAEQERMKTAIIEDAVAVCAVQLGVSLLLTETVLICVVPIGTIIAAVLAVIQVFTGIYTKHAVKEIIGQTIIEITHAATAVADQVKAIAHQIADEEFENAQKLAASGDPLNGLGDNFFQQTYHQAGGAVTDALRTVAKPVAKPLAQGITKTVGFVGQQVLKAGIVLTHVVGDKKGEEKLRHAQEAWATKSAYFEKQTIQLAYDPVALTRLSYGEPAKYLLGVSSIDTARKRCRSLQQLSDRQLADMKAVALAKINDPSYRVLVRINQAKLIRGDPDMLAKAQQVAQITQQATATIGRLGDAVDKGQPTVPASGGGGVIGLLAMVGGYLWLNK